MVDRCNDERRLHINTAKLLLEFGVAGFPLTELKKGIYRFMFRYPYLYGVRQGFAHFCQRELVLVRQDLENSGEGMHSRNI